MPDTKRLGSSARPTPPRPPTMAYRLPFSGVPMPRELPPGSRWKGRQMLYRKLAFACALLLAVPAFANNTQISPSQFAAQPPPVLRLMNDAEFSNFLQRLDADLLRAQSRIKKMDMRSLSLDAQETQDLIKSHDRCHEATN